jgi:hypothetical protein
VLKKLGTWFSTWSNWVNVLSKLAAVAVLIVGVVVVANHANDVGDDPDKEPTSTTIVTQKTGAHGDRPKVTTTTLTKAGTKQATVVRTASGTQTQRTTTVAPRDRSLVERALGGSGLIFFRLGLVLVAAFLAGAIIQRALLGKFAIKLPFVELGDLPVTASASTEAIEALRADANKQINVLTEQIDARLSSDASKLEVALATLAAVSRVLSQLERRVAEIETPKG